MPDVVIVGDDGDQDNAPGPDPVTLLHDRLTSLEERLAELAPIGHEHGEYATHEQLQGYAPIGHEHSEYVQHEELGDELDQLVADIDDDLEEALGLDESATPDTTTIEPVSLPDDDDDHHKAPGLFW